MSTAKDLFDMSLNLQMHESLMIPNYNKQHQESLRVSLSYNRRIFVENTDTDFDIIISKVTKGDKFYVQLQKLPRITAGIVISADGVTMRKALLSKEDPLAQMDSPLDEDSRIRKAMKEDGFSDKEIEEYLSKPSKNDGLLECLEKEEEGGIEDE